MPGVNPPRVPEGLRDLMKSLTKEVLREKPPNVYEFSAQYFEAILDEKRDFTVKGFEPPANYENFQYRERNQVPLSLVYTIIPEGLTELIKEFIKAVLRANPKNICEFAVEYFRRLRNDKNLDTVQYTAYENYFKSKDRFSFTPYLKCTCGRKIGEEMTQEHYKTKTDVSVVPSGVSFKSDSNEINRVNVVQTCTADNDCIAVKNDEKELNLINDQDLKKNISTTENANSETIATIDDGEKYMHAIFVIQRFFRKCLLKKANRKQPKNPNSTARGANTMTEEAAALVIQRSLRKLFDGKFQKHTITKTISTVPKLENFSHNDDSGDNVSEAASYTSASTALMSAESVGENSEIGLTNYDEGILHKTIMEDEEVENDFSNSSNEYAKINEARKSANNASNAMKSEIIKNVQNDSNENLVSAKDTEISLIHTKLHDISNKDDEPSLEKTMYIENSLSTKSDGLKLEITPNIEINEDDLNLKDTPITPDIAENEETNLEITPSTSETYEDDKNLKETPSTPETKINKETDLKTTLDPSDIEINVDDINLKDTPSDIEINVDDINLKDTPSTADIEINEAILSKTFQNAPSTPTAILLDGLNQNIEKVPILNDQSEKFTCGNEPQSGKNTPNSVEAQDSEVCEPNENRTAKKEQVVTALNNSNENIDNVKPQNGKTTSTSVETKNENDIMSPVPLTTVEKSDSQLPSHNSEAEVLLNTEITSPIKCNIAKDINLAILHTTEDTNSLDKNSEVTPQNSETDVLLNSETIQTPVKNDIQNDINATALHTIEYKSNLNDTKVMPLNSETVVLLNPKNASEEPIVESNIKNMETEFLLKESLDSSAITDGKNEQSTLAVNLPPYETTYSPNEAKNKNDIPSNTDSNESYSITQAENKDINESNNSSLLNQARTVIQISKDLNESDLEVLSPNAQKDETILENNLLQDHNNLNTVTSDNLTGELVVANISIDNSAASSNELNFIVSETLEDKPVNDQLTPDLKDGDLELSASIDDKSNKSQSLITTPTDVPENPDYEDVTRHDQNVIASKVSDNLNETNLHLKPLIDFALKNQTDVLTAENKSMPVGNESEPKVDVEKNKTDSEFTILKPTMEPDQNVSDSKDREKSKNTTAEISIENEPKTLTSASENNTITELPSIESNSESSKLKDQVEFIPVSDIAAYDKKVDISNDNILETLSLNNQIVKPYSENKPLQHGNSSTNKNDSNSNVIKSVELSSNNDSNNPILEVKSSNDLQNYALKEEVTEQGYKQFLDKSKDEQSENGAQNDKILSEENKSAIVLSAHAPINNGASKITDSENLSLNDQIYKSAEGRTLHEQSTSTLNNLTKPITINPKDKTITEFEVLFDQNDTVPKDVDNPSGTDSELMTLTQTDESFSDDNQPPHIYNSKDETNEPVVERKSLNHQTVLKDNNSVITDLKELALESQTNEPILEDQTISYQNTSSPKDLELSLEDKLLHDQTFALLKDDNPNKSSSELTELNKQSSEPTLEVQIIHNQNANQTNLDVSGATNKINEPISESEQDQNPHATDDGSNITEDKSAIPEALEDKTRAISTLKVDGKIIMENPPLANQPDIFDVAILHSAAIKIQKYFREYSNRKRSKRSLNTNDLNSSSELNSEKEINRSRESSSAIKNTELSEDSCLQNPNNSAMKHSCSPNVPISEVSEDKPQNQNDCIKSNNSSSDLNSEEKINISPDSSKTIENDEKHQPNLNVHIFEDPEKKVKDQNDFIKSKKSSSSSPNNEEKGDKFLDFSNNIKNDNSEKNSIDKRIDVEPEQNGNINAPVSEVTEDKPHEQNDSNEPQRDLVQRDVLHEDIAPKQRESGTKIENIDIGNLTSDSIIGTQNSQESINEIDNSEKSSNNNPSNLRKESYTTKHDSTGKFLPIAEIHLKSFKLSDSMEALPWYDAMTITSNKVVENNSSLVQNPPKIDLDTSVSSNDFKKYDVFYQESDPEFSDSLNETKFEPDSLEIASSSKETDMDEDSLELEQSSSNEMNNLNCEKERTATYLYGIHTPRQTPTQQRKVYKSPTAFTISFNDNTTTQLNITDNNSEHVDAKSLKDDLADIDEMSNKKLNLDKPKDLDLSKTLDTEVQLDMETPTKLFDELNAFDLNQYSMDATYTAEEKLSLNSSVQPEEIRPYGDSSESLDSINNFDEITLEVPQESLLHTIEEDLNESITPRPDHNALLKDIITNEITSELMKQIIPSVSEDALENISGSEENDSELTSSWTCSKDLDETFLSDEYLNENDEDTTYYRNKRSTPTDVTDSNAKGGIYEIDTNQIKLEKSTNNALSDDETLIEQLPINFTPTVLYEDDNDVNMVSNKLNIVSMNNSDEELQNTKIDSKPSTTEHLVNQVLNSDEISSNINRNTENGDLNKNVIIQSESDETLIEKLPIHLNASDLNKDDKDVKIVSDNKINIVSINNNELHQIKDNNEEVQNTKMVAEPFITEPLVKQILNLDDINSNISNIIEKKSDETLIEKLPVHLNASDLNEDDKDVNMLSDNNNINIITINKNELKITENIEKVENTNIDMKSNIAEPLVNQILNSDEINSNISENIANDQPNILCSDTENDYLNKNVVLKKEGVEIINKDTISDNESLTQILISQKKIINSNKNKNNSNDQPNIVRSNTEYDDLNNFEIQSDIKNEALHKNTDATSEEFSEIIKNSTEKESKNNENLNQSLLIINQRLSNAEKLIEDSVTQDLSKNTDLKSIEDTIIELRNSAIQLSKFENLMSQAPTPPQHDPDEETIEDVNSVNNDENVTIFDVAILNNAAIKIQKYFRVYSNRKRSKNAAIDILTETTSENKNSSNNKNENIDKIEKPNIKLSKPENEFSDADFTYGSLDKYEYTNIYDTTNILNAVKKIQKYFREYSNRKRRNNEAVKDFTISFSERPQLNNEESHKFLDNSKNESTSGKTEKTDIIVELKNLEKGFSDSDVSNENLEKPFIKTAVSSENTAPPATNILQPPITDFSNNKTENNSSQIEISNIGMELKNHEEINNTSVDPNKNIEEPCINKSVSTNNLVQLDVNTLQDEKQPTNFSNNNKKNENTSDQIKNHEAVMKVGNLEEFNDLIVPNEKFKEPSLKKSVYSDNLEKLAVNTLQDEHQTNCSNKESMNKLEQAAIIIQKYFRGSSTRRQFKNVAKENFKELHNDDKINPQREYNDNTSNFKDSNNEHELKHLNGISQPLENHETNKTKNLAASIIQNAFRNYINRRVSKGDNKTSTDNSWDESQITEIYVGNNTTLLNNSNYEDSKPQANLDINTNTLNDNDSINDNSAQSNFFYLEPTAPEEHEIADEEEHKTVKVNWFVGNEPIVYTVKSEDNIDNSDYNINLSTTPEVLPSSSNSNARSNDLNTTSTAPLVSPNINSITTVKVDSTSSSFENDDKQHIDDDKSIEQLNNFAEIVSAVESDNIEVNSANNFSNKDLSKEDQEDNIATATSNIPESNTTVKVQEQTSEELNSQSKEDNVDNSDYNINLSTTPEVLPSSSNSNACSNDLNTTSTAPLVSPNINSISTVKVDSTSSSFENDDKEHIDDDKSIEQLNNFAEIVSAVESDNIEVNSANNLSNEDLSKEDQEDNIATATSNIPESNTTVKVQEQTSEELNSQSKETLLNSSGNRNKSADDTTKVIDALSKTNSLVNSASENEEDLNQNIKENAKVSSQQTARTKSKTETEEDIQITPNLDTSAELIKLDIVMDFMEMNLNSDIPYEPLEEPCIKKSFSQTHLDELMINNIENNNFESTALNDTESTDSHDDTIDAITEKLRETEGVIEKMQQRRASETKSVSVEEKTSKASSFDEPVIRSMQELQTISTPDLADDEAVVLSRLQRDDTRESSAQSDSVVFGGEDNDEAEATEEDFDESPIVRASLKRLHTIAGGDPKLLFKSVTIDDTIKYIEPPENETTATSDSSFCLDDDTSENIRQKMMAYSLSEADSDFFASMDKTKVNHDDFNISTALLDTGGTSTDTESTIVSAATKIQAGARGFITRRRLRRASAGTNTFVQDEKASFGNDAISESLEQLIEYEAAKKIQHAYRKHFWQKKAAAGASEDGDFHSTSLAARRLTLQRGDALRNDSAPDDENGANGIRKDTVQEKSTDVEVDLSVSKAVKSTSTEAPSADNTNGVATKEPTKKVIDNKLKWLALRQNSMPVQIDCEVFRVIPKHMRKRIKSAEGVKKGRRIIFKD